MIIDHNRSDIVEQLFISSLVHEREKDDVTEKQSPYLRQAFTIYDEIQRLLLPYKEKIEQLVFSNFGYSNLLHQTYFTCLEKGQDPATIEEFHEFALKLSVEEIHHCLEKLLRTEESHATDFLVLLEESDLNSETKWHYLSFYRHPLEKMAELISLSRELVVVYQPFLEREREKRELHTMSESLKMEVEESKEKYGLMGEVQVAILSSWFLRSYFIKRTADTVLYVKSLGISEWTQNLLQLEDGHFYEVLKLLSDPSRYQAMLRLTEPRVKRNQIAEDLGITGAAVSFHTQKLLTAQLLQQNTQDQHIKYDVNTDLLAALVERLRQDFHF